MKKTRNFDEVNKFIPQNNNEENYAILSHYMEISDLEAKNKKKNELINNFDFTEEMLNQAEDFFSTLNVPFKCKKNPKFTFIDLFAGIGGFRLAMQNNGGKCVFSSEWDEAAKQTYYANYGEVPYGDITKSEIKDLIPENFDILCAGFPCQAFSIAGYQKGFDDVRGTLFFDVADILEKYQPKAFFLENVKNLKSHDNGKTFAKIMDVLQNRLGYKVFEKVMNPCEYANIPQNRERIFIVGFNPRKLDLSNNLNFQFPEKQKLTNSIHSIIDDSVENLNLFYKENHIYFNKMKDVVINPNTIYQWRRIYVRENKSGLCPTLTANMGTGGHNVPIVKTSKGIRKLTTKECLAFQGYPKNYEFPNTIAESKKYKQAGNSVTTPLIEKVAKEIIKQILNK